MADIRIHNTSSKKLESFVPIDANKVMFYHCGPTVYWTQHIGNMRSMVLADIIRRTLLYFHYQVRFVRNYTDVGHLTGDNIGDADTGEDKMAKGARRENTTPQKIADKYIEVFEADSRALNIMPPDEKPRATEYITEMIEMVQSLLDKGFAYTTKQAIYFDISKFPDYTKLSGQKLSENIVGAGKGDVTDSEKRHPQDFAVWFFKTGVHKNALQTWQSPFQSSEVENGEGFPGWHIECSAMAKAELAAQIDIHMGGIEHIPVHHTNEIAQSEAANSTKFVNYWLHNEWLMIDGGKISKSDGTAVVLEDLVHKGFDPLVLRYFFLNAHYRSKQNFTWEGMQQAQSAYENLIKKLSQLNDHAYKQGSVLEIWRAKFCEALAEDFNVPQALAVVWDLIKSEAEPEDKLETILDFDTVLGLKLSQALSSSTKDTLSKEDRQKVELLIAKRNEAREAKNWEEADRIRDLLSDKYSVKLKDNGSQTDWQII
jgi:cysteinyl-tRNA synthetase